MSDLVRKILEKYKNIVGTPSFQEYIKNKVRPPLTEYANIEWDDVKLLEIVHRGQVGGIYGPEALLITEIFKQFTPKLTLEVGRFNGNSTKLFCALCSMLGGKLVSIDGKSAKGVSSELDQMNLSQFAILREEWTPWISFDYLENIDFLFIDGDHSYISVLVDYHYFNYFMEKDSIIAFHDINIKEVSDAIASIQKRDKLLHIATVQRLMVFQKLTEKNEKYFQIIKRS